jgi:hypothetical protein
VDEGYVMPEFQEDVYQDNGFELVVYKNRKADSFRTCPDCGKAVFHVASVYDEWQEGHSSLIEYHYCRRDKHIIQESTRSRPDGKSSSRQFHEMPPYEMVMQLLAHARHIQGRGITRLTINRRWWSAWRYPLAMGDKIATRMPRVRPIAHDDAESGKLQDGQSLRTTPLPRYQPTEVKRSNPFTNRRVSREEELEAQHAEEENALKSDPRDDNNQG